MTYPDPYQQEPQYPSDQQPYQQYPPYQQQPAYYPAAPYPAPGQGTNTMALLSLIFSLLGLVTGITAPVGVVMGHVAKRQLRTSGEGGEGLATAGLIIGYILTGLLLITCCGALAFVIFAGSHSNTTS